MKIVFFGTSDFAVLALEALCLKGYRILAVVTAADKKKGRGLKFSFSPVKVFAEKKGLYLWQPQDLYDNKFLQFLKQEPAELFVVAAFGKILTKEILQIPLNCAINLHASLLPKYRGAAPINWAIIKGERETGVTVFKMNEYMDKGEIILQEKTDISLSDTAITLTEKLSKLGQEAMVKAIDMLKDKKVTFIKQDEDKASLAPKLRKEDGLLDWQRPATEIQNRIRGLQPWPGAFTYFRNGLLKLWESQVVKDKKTNNIAEIAEIDPAKGILVQTGKDKLLITVLQLAGKRKMSAVEFVLGHNVKVGEKLG